MSAAPDPFAAAVGAEPRGRPLTVALPAGLPLESVLLGVIAGPDGTAAALVPVTVGGRSGAALALGDASAILSATLLDLAQATTLDLTVAAPAAAAQPRRPALLVRTRLTTTGGERDRLLLVGLTAVPEVLWEAIIHETGAGPGGGFESLELTLKPRADRPDLTLLQHALPSAGAADFMPGPPLTLEYRWRHGQWQREP